MERTTIARPGKKFKSGNNNYYIRLNGKMIMLDQDSIDNWDSLLTITLEEVEYTKRAPKADGSEDELVGTDGLVEDNWTRVEIVDYTTTTRDFVLAEHKVKLDKLQVGEASVDTETVRALGAKL